MDSGSLRSVWEAAYCSVGGSGGGDVEGLRSRSEAFQFVSFVMAERKPSNGKENVKVAYMVRGRCAVALMVVVVMLLAVE